MHILSILSIAISLGVAKTYAACWSEKLGYKCCTTNFVVYSEDSDGKWSIENNDWCGIQYSDSCWSEKLGFPCCKNTKEVVTQDNDGKWGVENDNWCGIVDNTAQSNATSNNTSSCAGVPNKPNATLLNSNSNDPAGNRDISDSIKGDSLKNAAPFRMGVGIYGSSLSTSGIISKKMRDIIAYQFNSITYTNLMKMDYMLNKSASQSNAKNGNDMPVLKFDTIIDGLEFCKLNNIHMRGHTLVWHVQAPEWFFRTNFQDNGAFANAQKMEQRMESYIKQLMQFVQCHYPGVVDVWDVVNEAVEIDQGSFDSSTGWNTRTKFDSGKKDNLWYKTMGPDYVFKAFRFARKYADKDVKLVYNDYNTFMSQKTNAIKTLVSKLKAENLVDAVGLQSYLGASWPAVKDYKSAIQQFSSLGVDIQVTELTISTDGSGNKFNQQASRYQEVFKAYMELKRSGVNITSVTLFGLQDGYLLYDNDTTDTRFWDHDLKKKPVYSAVMQVLKS